VVLVNKCTKRFDDYDYLSDNLVATASDDERRVIDQEDGFHPYKNVIKLSNDELLRCSMQYGNNAYDIRVAD